MELSSVIEISGEKGEFVSGGRAVAHNGRVTATQDGAESVSLRFREGEDDWELDVSALGGTKLRSGEFLNAVRYSFAQAGHASMSVTGAGHACNEVRGKFVIRRLDRD